MLQATEKRGGKLSRSFQKIASGLYVNGLLAELNQNPQLWDQHPQRRVYPNSPHSQMQDIWVRFGRGDVTGEHDSEWYESAELLPSAKMLAFWIMSAVDGERLGGILITRLPAGAEIAPHIDQGWHAGYYEKFYVALTSPGVFGFEDGEIISEPGDCYLFRNDRTHWVNNDTKEERLTMIVCIKTDKFKAL